MPSSEIIVIGAGVNGLACAIRLARKGREVLLLEAAETPGGGASTRDFAPGWRAPALAHLTQGLDPRLMQEMGLAGQGLVFQALPTVALSTAGDHLTVRGGLADGPDGAAFAALHARLSRLAGALAPFRRMPPPRLAAGRGWGSYLRPGLGLRGLGRDEFRELLRMMLINVHDVAEDELTDDRLRGLLAFDATLGAWLGPRSPNSLILYLDRLARGPAALWPVGGMGALADALAQAAVAAGVTLRCRARVEKVFTKADRAAGVRLDTGEEIAAATVVSAISPRTTLQALVGPEQLDAGFYRRSQHIRSRGGAAKLHLALSGTPDFRGADLRARLVIAPSSDAVEAAFNPVKYGEVPEAPVMEIVLPSALEPGHGPAGGHVLSAIVQFAPHAPKAGLAAARAQLLEASLRVLERHAPGLRGLVAHAEMLMPQDIEARFGMPGGNWHHGELAVEQMLFNRPMAGAAGYATPLPGLWLAGAGSHPGGGIEGTAGCNAAGAVLEGRG